MAALDTIDDQRTRRHSHHDSATTGETRCPWCSSIIPRQAFEEIKTRIEAEERARIVNEQEQAAARTKAEIARVKKDAAAAVAAQIKAFRASQESTIALRVHAAREASEKRLAQTLTAERSKAYGEKLKLTEQLADMQRRLEQRTAHELGEAGEVDLFVALKTEFPADQITRIGKGVPGADVVHAVTSGNGEIVGTILIDSKNVSRFMTKYVAKLRADQLRAEADFSVLAITAPLPDGQQQLAVMDSVIVAHPARVVAVVHLLRRLLVQMHRMQLGNAGRLEKAEALYRFVISPAGSDLLDRIVHLTHDLTDLDAKETKSHQQVWRQRADLIAAIRDTKDQFSDTVTGIVSTIGEIGSTPSAG